NNKTIELEKSQNRLQEIEKNIDEEKNNMIRIYNNSSDKKSELNSIVSFNENVEKRITQLKKEIEYMSSQRKSNFDKYREYEKNENEINAKLLNLIEKAKSMKNRETEYNNSLNL